ncbi:cytochrome c oxidase assembly protein [Rhodovulum sp. DZ06]|uniref:cytochrome c oxidase assembly protein n=1 Tax=Rhodovulum sp. DZ06 TaxID=3425126 RepID=UPI003D337568
MALTSQQKTVAWTVGIVTFMGAMGFASVPLYDWFCRVTGYGGETQVATGGEHKVLDRTVKIRFDANTERGMPWDFRPEVTQVELKIGETGLAFYEAHNPTDRPVAGTASYNVAPFSAGSYFVKIDCFCFEMQVLQPGETVKMPVTFYVDPELVDDAEAKDLKTITLSYTFHETDLPEAEAEKAAALEGGSAPSVN